MLHYLINLVIKVTDVCMAITFPWKEIYHGLCNSLEEATYRRHWCFLAVKDIGVFSP